MKLRYTQSLVFRIDYFEDESQTLMSGGSDRPNHLRQVDATDNPRHRGRARPVLRNPTFPPRDIPPNPLNAVAPTRRRRHHRAQVLSRSSATRGTHANSEGDGVAADNRRHACVR